MVNLSIFGGGTGVVAWGPRSYHALMPIQVFSPSKPAAPGRALMISALLLAGVCALAGTMAWQRAGHPLVPRIRPSGWDISFQQPAGFIPGDLVKKELGAALPFHPIVQSALRMELVVWQIPVTTTAGADIGHRVMRRYTGWSLPDLLGTPPAKTNATIGPLDAIELRQPNTKDGGIIVRTAVLSHRRLAYSISLAVSGGPIDDRLYRVFDRTCRSVSLETQ